MAPPKAAARGLSLTEELERLEQSITLTLQEIDQNFSKAHRIVTTSILPLVEQYGDHSRSVWEASKFWKQFFEASANVSLSGYEELANDADVTVATMEESSAMREDITGDYTVQSGKNYDETKREAGPGLMTVHGEESLLDDGEISGSTPRPPVTKTFPVRLSNLESPYETMKREMKNEEDNTTVLEDDEDSSILFAQKTARLPDMSMTPQHALEDRTMKQSITRSKDPLLHHVLDRTYRLQATPHRPAYRISPLKKPNKKQTSSAAAWQDLPASSPDITVPKLRSEAFFSPLKMRTTAANHGPRTPGASVTTPARNKQKMKDALDPQTGDAAAEPGAGRKRYGIDWDSDEDGDEDLFAGMSPPKTIQFALPLSKLLQTPAREARKQIIDKTSLDAGEDPASSEYSPTLVKMNEGILNDGF